MGENKTKTKAAMLDELESIKGLLLEEDDIPILQEVIDNKDSTDIEPPAAQKPVAAINVESAPSKNTIETKLVYEEQQDFFNPPSAVSETKPAQAEAGKELLDTLSELEKHTAEVTANKIPADKSVARPGLAKATGENPFLPQHIRARLHGNNPPPLFETETARKIATSTVPTRQLGNTFSSPTTSFGSERISSQHKDIIDSIVEKMMPELEKELRNRLELMTKNLLDEFNR